MSVEKRIAEQAKCFDISEIVLYIEGVGKDKRNMKPATQEVVRQAQVEIARQRSQGAKLIVVLVRPGYLISKDGNAEFRFVDNGWSPHP